jgi:hypothetical protein
MPATLAESEKIQERYPAAEAPRADMAGMIEPPLTEDELADLLQVPRKVLMRMRKRCEGPGWVMCAGNPRYPLHEVRKFLNVRPARQKMPVAKNVPVAEEK